MNANVTGEQPNFELPPAKDEAGPVQYDSQHAERMNSEKVSKITEKPQGTQPQASGSAVNSVPGQPSVLPSQLAYPGGTDDNLAAQTDNNTPITPGGINPPVQAEDSDLIEQAWVNKAKAIVDSTRDDPHKQNKEINKIKAEYIKKRYNKEVKTGEEQE